MVDFFVYLVRNDRYVSRLRLRWVTSVAGALTTVDVKDFARHEAGRLKVEDRVDDVGDLAHMADWVQDAKLRMGLDGDATAS